MTSKVLLQKLDLSLVDVWVDIYRAFHGKYPWPKPIKRSDVVALVDQPETKPLVASCNGKPFAIATLKVTDNPELLSISSFASKGATPDTLDSMVMQLVALAKDMSMKQLTMWTWDTESMVIEALIKKGFEITARDSLISKDLTEARPITPSGAAEVRSISEGVTVSQFVRSNREAFKDDPSRPLEEEELKEWLGESKGFHSDCQLAAFVGGKVVGTIMSEIFERPGRGGEQHEAWIYGLGVVAAYRRQGIASLLLQNLEFRLKERGVSKLWLFTDTEGGIRDFYDQAGFVQVANCVDMGLCLNT